MNDEWARSLFMDYLYDEIDNENRRKLVAYLENNTELKEEFNEFRQVRNMLQHAPPVESPKKMIMVEPKQRTLRQWWNEVLSIWPDTVWGRAGLAAAVAVIILLLAGSLARIQLQVNDAGFSLSLGSQPDAENTVTPRHLQEMMDEMRMQNTAILEQVVDNLQQENRRQLQEVVTYMEQERTKDIRAVKAYIEQYQHLNNTRWQQADEYLNQIYYSMNR